jgi:hypothetical protein
MRCDEIQKLVDMTELCGFTWPVS